MLLYFQLRISKGAESVCFHLFMDTVVSAVTSGDRLQVIKGEYNANTM